MAYLNVRERRIETKIAYVGPALSGKATNLQQLKRNSTRGRSGDVELQGDILSLEWRPLQMERFNDCDLAVKLVAPKGTISTERLDVVLQDADGIVVVVDAAPSAQAENHRAMKLVREALSRANSRRSDGIDRTTGATEAESRVRRANTPAMSVVVQLNKSDLGDALPASELTKSLADHGGTEWPVVTASAARGEGVIETLELALSNVIDALKSKIEDPDAARPSVMDENPLLAALRDILRETVSEHMAHVEKAAAERLALVVTDRLEQTERAVQDVCAAMTVSAKETVRALSAQQAALADIAARIADLHVKALTELGEIYAVTAALASKVETKSSRN